MPDQDEVGQHAHQDPLLVAVDDRVGVELPGATRAHQLEVEERLLGVRVVLGGQHQALVLIAPDPADHLLEGVHGLGLGRALGGGQVVRGHPSYRHAGQVALDADGLELLQPLLEVPGPVGGPEQGLRPPGCPWRSRSGTGWTSRSGSPWWRTAAGPSAPSPGSRRSHRRTSACSVSCARIGIFRQPISPSLCLLRFFGSFSQGPSRRL